MKRVYITLVFAVLAFVAMAQHHLGVTLSGVTTYSIDNIDDTKSRWGGGGEIGAVYHLQKNRFLFQTGVNFSYSTSALGVDTMNLSAPMIDTDGTTFTYKGVVYDRVDRSNVAELSLPLMFGVKVSYFYALVGAKFVYPIMTTTRQTALLTTYGDYGGMFYEDFVDMPQHGYYSGQPVETKGKMNFAFDVRPSIELGGMWALSGISGNRKSQSAQIAVGIFAECGVLNALTKAENELVDVDYTKYMNVKINHIYSTMSAAEAIVNNLRIGLRVSLLFPVSEVESKRKKCMCIDYVNRKHSGYRNRRR